MRVLVRGTAALCGLLNVAALLAWVSGLGAFHLWFLAVGLPALVVLVAISIWSARHPEADPSLRRALVAGAFGGLLGTIGYDLFRIPFIVGGLRLFAPIDSYGVLLLDAGASSQLTGFAGWSYHFTNGIGFGIFYAVVALGRRWPWAVLWGLVLETATILTPFADSYAIAGKWDLIAIAYAAHLAYGIPLGLVVQRAARWDPHQPLPIPLWVSLAALAVGLVVWLRPTPSVPQQPTTHIVDGRFVPEWVRIRPDECAAVTNTDDRPYESDRLDVRPGATAEVCDDDVGVHRIRIEDEPYAGGFLLVDDEA
jgi:hypothetical protein